MTFDELRTRLPELGFAVYAYEPGGPVTLEVLTPAGETFTFQAGTEAEAIAAAFPPPMAVPESEESSDVFD